MVSHGDFQTWITENFHRSLTKIIEAKASRRTPYYILVIVKKGYNGPSHTINVNKTVEKNFEGNTLIHTRILIIDRPPVVKMIGSSLWRIDNRIGEARCIYILPPDKPVMGGDIEGPESELVAKSGQGMPLVYNRV